MSSRHDVEDEQNHFTDIAWDLYSDDLQLAVPFVAAHVVPAGVALVSCGPGGDDVKRISTSEYCQTKYFVSNKRSSGATSPVAVGVPAVLDA